MDYIDVSALQTMLLNYGVKHTVEGLIQALRDTADHYSDMGLKEKAIQAANMADALQDLNGE